MNTSQEDILNTVFIELSNMPSEVSPTQVDVIKKYLIEVYYPQEKITSLTELRLKYFFKSSDPKLRSLIISNDGLINHINRSALQAGWLWKQCEHNVVCPDPTKWGWIRSDNKCTPKWCNEYKNINDVITTCSCKEKANYLRCKCGRSMFQCIEFCSCTRMCYLNTI